MDSPDLGQTIEVAIRGLSAVADQTSIDSVPSIKLANEARPRDRLGGR